MLTPLKMRILSSGQPAYVLAARARVAPSRFSLLVNGHELPRQAEADRIAEALGCDTEELFGQKQKVS